MTLKHPLYDNLKGRAYGAAQLVTGRSNPEAQREGFRDVFDLIMSDSDHSRQPAFLGLVAKELSEDQRKILLDGMAKEYAGCDGWLAYVDRECAGDDWEKGLGPNANSVILASQNRKP